MQFGHGTRLVSCLPYLARFRSSALPMNPPAFDIGPNVLVTLFTHRLPSHVSHGRGFGERAMRSLSFAVDSGVRLSLGFS